jgi:hypothetical protein
MIPRRIAYKRIYGKRKIAGIVDFVLPVSIEKGPFGERSANVFPTISATNRFVKDERGKADLRNTTATDQVAIHVRERFPRCYALE